MAIIEQDVLEGVLPDLIALRHTIHSWPDLSGHEMPTANRLLDYLSPFKPEQVHKGLSGCGLAVVFAGNQAGPTTIFSCELDAVPIADRGRVIYRSQVPEAGHMCGHDGHMAAVAGLGVLLGKRRPLRGQVVLLFRPQEETGQGAPVILADPRIVEMNPDYIFGFHNMPGYPLGAVLYRRGLFAWAATDYVFELIGKSSHGGQPEAGRSPAMALSQIIERLENLTAWSGLDPECNDSQAAYAQLGESDHGTTPGIARMRATLRSESDEALKELCRKIDQAVGKIARAHGLQWHGLPENWIPATHSHGQALDLVLACAREAGLHILELDQAQRWSDDFGVLTQHYPGAFIGLGSGSGCGQLHSSDYDFPDDILKSALQLYWRIVTQLNG